MSQGTRTSVNRGHLTSVFSGQHTSGLTADGTRVQYRSFRKHAETAITVEDAGPLARPDPLVLFLTERYRLYTTFWGALASAPVEHRPWPLHEARLVTLRETVREAATGPEPSVASLDLASLASVRECAAELAERHPAVDILMNNAGVMAVPKGTTADGFERQIGTNHLGHFALTGLLLPTLLAAAAPRVVTVSSNAHKMGRMQLDDLSFERTRYSRWRAYGQSKLANLLFAYELQRRLTAAGSSVSSLAAHPGYSSTNLQYRSESWHGKIVELVTPIIGQSPQQGALPTLYAATSPNAEPGGYYGPDSFFEMRGTSTPEEVTPESSPPRVQNTPPPVASTSGRIFSSVAVTSLISRASSIPACATAVSWPRVDWVSIL